MDMTKVAVLRINHKLISINVVGDIIFFVILRKKEKEAMPREITVIGRGTWHAICVIMVRKNF